MQYHDVDIDLTFDLAAVTFSLNICPGSILETIRCRKLILGRDIVLPHLYVWVTLKKFKP